MTHINNTGRGKGSGTQAKQTGWKEYRWIKKVRTDMFTLCTQVMIICSKVQIIPHLELSIVLPSSKSRRLLHWTYKLACGRAH